MKTKMFLIFILSSLISVQTYSQKKERKDYVWQYNGKNKTHTVGLYGGLYGSYSPVNSDAAGYLGYRIGVVFDHRFGIGLAAYGLSYDRTLKEIVSDGNYHLQAGYAGLFLEYIQPISKNLKASVSMLMAQGVALYQYDKDYREGKEWYQETIDRDNFHVTEPGIEIQTRIAGNWWIGANATYRLTSPIKMMGTNESMLQNYSAGISLKYGVF